MTATGIAALLLIVTLVFAGLGWFRRSKALAVVAAILFGLLSLYVLCLVFVISGM